MTSRILAVAGTRPEAIKMAPVILALRKEPWADLRVIATAQHRQLLDRVFDLFGIGADIDLNVMRPDQSLPALTARLLNGFDRVLEEERPAAVLAQGDTTTVMAAALSCSTGRPPSVMWRRVCGREIWPVRSPRKRTAR